MWGHFCAGSLAGVIRGSLFWTLTSTWSCPHGKVMAREYAGISSPSGSGSVFLKSSLGLSTSEAWPSTVHLHDPSSQGGSCREQLLPSVWQVTLHWYAWSSAAGARQSATLQQHLRHIRSMVG